MTAQNLTTERQWLLTNGLGGFAFGTEAGIPTRRYHGLLVAAINPPVRRTVALHSIVEQVRTDDAITPLTTYCFGDELLRHPDGWKHLAGFARIGPQEVSWTYDLGRLHIEKLVRLHHHRNAVSVVYRLEGALPKLLRLRPMTPLRGFHSMAHQGWNEPDAQQVASAAMLVHSGDMRLRLIGRCSAVEPAAHVQPQWWNDVRYVEDRARGQDWAEDLWSPGALEFDLSNISKSSQSVECRLDAEIAAPMLPPVRVAVQRTVAQRATDRLQAGAEQFVVKRLSADRGGYFDSIIAGYPWFADWGRDSMISLPGLLICTGHVDRAVSVLQAFVATMRNGLIPNCFDDEGGGAQYNSVDASLWFVHSVSVVYEDVDTATAGSLVEHCRQIVKSYQRGTDFDIHVDDDGLVTAGNEHTQITWMDAARDGVVFTPRHGKAVEVNALWYNALRCLAAMTDRQNERDTLRACAERTADSFRARFWWEQRKCLHDVLSPNGDGEFTADGKLRPNQIFAVSLPFSPLHVSQQRAVVATVERRLLTPFGLRTLDPDDSDYIGRFEGDLFARDGAYHQGTVWPWLIGPFCEALLRIHRFDDASKARVRDIIAPLLHALDSGCIGQIAEVYDGDAPHRPDGCVAQAWSVAELLRVQHLLNTHSHRGHGDGDGAAYAAAASPS